MLRRVLTPLTFSTLFKFLSLRRTIAGVLVAALSVMLVSPPALAQGKRTIIRDAEIENIIRDYTTPLLEAAGLDPAQVRIRMIQDKSLNAFVAGGQNIYLHTGLLVESKGPNAVIGVIAHETGHIEGGHLSRTRAAIEDAAMIQMIGTLLGVVAAVGSNSPDVGSAVIMGSQGSGQGVFLNYSRTQESAADQAAMRLLDDTEQSARGLEGFLSQLGDQEVLSPRYQDPYARTHPLSRERINTLRAHIANSPYSDVPPSADKVLSHQIMVAKLYSYMEPFEYTMRKYPETDLSFPARYARAIAHYRKPDIKTALRLMDELIVDQPRNPYLWEMKGQMLFEHGRSQEALEAYQRAHHLAPDEPLIVVALARVELESGRPELLDKAIEHFRTATRMGTDSAFVWQQLGIAYGRKGDIGMSSLALAEAELRRGQLANARFQAERAASLLQEGSSAHLQALDLQEAIKVQRARQK